MLHRLTLTFTLLLVSVAVVATVPPLPLGEWKHDGGDAEKKRMESIVNGIVDDMSFVLRPIARPRLKKECAPYTKLVITRDGPNVTIATSDETFTTPLDKTVKRKAAEGEVNVKRWVEDGVLYEKIWSDDGSRTNGFHKTGDRLVVKSTISAPRLPRPITFRYTYR